MLGLGAMVIEVDDNVGANVSIDETDFAARFGGGLEAYLTETIALTFDVDSAVAVALGVGQVLEDGGVAERRSREASGGPHPGAWVVQAALSPIPAIGALLEAPVPHRPPLTTQATPIAVDIARTPGI